MLKHIYRAIILLCIFSGSVYYFGLGMKEEVFNLDKTIEMSRTTFPIVTMKIDDSMINLLHGYSNNMNASLMRESMTPLSNDQSLTVYIDEKENDVKRVIYELRDVSDNKLIETDTINALEKMDEYKTAKVKVKEPLVEGQEYTVKITLVTSESRKMSYYTRVIKITNSYYKEKLDFVMDIHKSLLDKAKSEEMVDYFEPNDKADNSSFSYVDIHSSFDLISYGDLNPTVISETVPTITEINSDFGLVELSYIISAETDYGTEYYNVRELYRVRYTQSRMYLLNYERTMESVFDIGNLSLSKSELKIGITRNKDLELVTSSNDSKLAFVRERELWYYNLAENLAVKVFSFKQKNTDYIRDNYDGHDVKILNMDDSGNISFMVYGYMNRGPYEGKVAIVLYQFYNGENRIEELVYIPVNVPYQILKEEIHGFSYVNSNSIFYFTLNHNIYAYNLTTKSLSTVATNVKDEDFVYIKDLKYIAIQDNGTIKESKTIRVINLETGEERIMKTPKDSNINLLGSIDSHIIFGYVYTDDISTNIDGSELVPMYQISIVDVDGKVLKKYNKDGYYISNIKVEGNVITLERVIKNVANGKTNFIPTTTDNILNKVTDKTKIIDTNSRITEKTKTEVYIFLPKGYVLLEKPTVSKTVNTIISKDTTLRIEGQDTVLYEYIVYAFGKVKGVYDSLGEAVTMANNAVGTVLDKKGQVVWERKLRSNTIEISDISKIYTSDSVNSLKAVSDMMINYQYGDIIKGTEERVNNMDEYLRKYFGDSLINLTGATLDEMLYYVGSKRPVIAMKNDRDAVLIIGYDAFNITVIDPELRRTMKLGLKDATAMFKDAGNVFFSYYTNTK
jgi:hypothetical protein